MPRSLSLKGLSADQARARIAEFYESIARDSLRRLESDALARGEDPDMIDGVLAAGRASAAVNHAALMAHFDDVVVPAMRGDRSR